MKKTENKLVKEVLDDFEQRVRARKSFDNQWQLNMNFYMGNQFCDVGFGGFVREIDRQYFWQEREVFNHIAPILDVRLSKLAKIKPKMRILPSTNDEADIYTAKVGKKILDSVSNKMNLLAKINQATKWSEICGTSFYKVAWNSNLGQIVALEEDGKKIKSGDVDIMVCSPFEIYPDSATHENLQDCESIIHAKAYSAEQIKQMYGVDVVGKEINVYSLDGVSSSLGGLGISGYATKLIETTRKNSAIVIEKYVRPNEDYPNGRLIIVAGDQLVFDGDLPYENGIDGKREFPFVRQICNEEVGNFWGVSMIARLIPIQRAYNAVKNRKHEYLNRLTMGVLAVEDGSLDIDNLEEEGLAPGKVLIYRQGSTPPKFLEGEKLSNDFEKEEEWLLKEFSTLSGTSELGNMENISASMSGVALELLLDENESRLKFTTDSIKTAIKTIGKQILRLYKQFATLPRLEKIVGENGDLDVFYFRGSDISSDDVQFDSEADNTDTISQRRDMIFKLLDQGLLQDENGKLSNSVRNKVLENIGFGVWETSVDLNELQIKNADSENKKLSLGEKIDVKEIDDHNLHLNQHIGYMLKSVYSASVDKELEERFLEHIRAHKKAKGE
ncbi:MAG: hypothetical protein E7375_03630 [Clostridiales bacterium]|nr:hypothetical protein [Clostridiales bacterium]